MWQIFQPFNCLTQECVFLYGQLLFLFSSNILNENLGITHCKKNHVIPGSTFINENVVLRANGHSEEKQTADF